MVTPWTYRVFALTMAFLVGISSVSWAVVEHYCQGALHNVSLIVDTGCCHSSDDTLMESCSDDKISCCKAPKSDNKDCCTDEVDLIDHETTVIIPLDDDIEYTDQLFSCITWEISSNHWPMAKIASIRGPSDGPPLLTCPDLARIQSWLI